VFSVPEVSFLLMAAGMLAVAVWLALPHMIWVPVLGAVAVAAGICGSVALPLSPAAAVLLIVAAVCLAAEVFVAPGLLLHGAGGRRADHRRSVPAPAVGGGTPRHRPAHRATHRAGHLARRAQVLARHPGRPLLRHRARHGPGGDRHRR
jgi:hypothetical protein